MEMVQVPYKDPEKSRGYQRDYKRLKRAGESQTPCQTQVPVSFRLKTAQDIVALLEEQVKAVRDEKDAAKILAETNDTPKTLNHSAIM